jgi:hypothetical protein
MASEVIQSEGAFDATVRTAINRNFAAHDTSIAALQARITATAPAAANSAGTPLTIAIPATGDYLYLCVATNTWVRCAVATWA